MPRCLGKARTNAQRCVCATRCAVRVGQMSRGRPVSATATPRLRECTHARARKCACRVRIGASPKQNVALTHSDNARPPARRFALSVTYNRPVSFRRQRLVLTSRDYAHSATGTSTSIAVAKVAGTFCRERN